MIEWNDLTLDCVHDTLNGYVRTFGMLFMAFTRFIVANVCNAITDLVKTYMSCWVVVRTSFYSGIVD